MVKCLTDFSCWETIAKLAPIGTALIVLIAAIIALGAMWVQMHIARRRASIDFFLKTEMDKTVIDLYNKCKANAPLIAFVPDPSNLTRSDYNDTRAFLNICPQHLRANRCGREQGCILEECVGSILG